MAKKRLFAVPAAVSKRFTDAPDMKSAQYVGGKMMVKTTTMQIKCAAGRTAP
jgi:hypothetical protein